MLLTMKVLTHAARCLAYIAAAALDASQAASTDSVRDGAARRLGLLIPLAKAWCSDVAVEVASLGVQVHGGTGYVDDCEASQIYRDARIGPIFEGTNYIQAHDLLARKVIRDRGAALGELLAEMERAAQLVGPSHGLAAFRDQLLGECTRLREAAGQIIHSATSEPELAGCVAYAFLQWLAVLAGGWQWALTAHQATLRPPGDRLGRSLIDCAKFYAAHVLPRARASEAVVKGGALPVMGPELTEI
jgi:3-(methylsulfanyl)propanoyl-CoA dehydrogenase